jgi:hypothetical protein
MLIAAGLCSTPAAVSAKAVSPFGVSCSGSAASAINQYCEDIPSATGGHQVTPGVPALATTLRPMLRRALVRNAPADTRAARQALLRLPAPGPPARASGAQPSAVGRDASAASVSGFSLVWGLAALVAAIGCAFAALSLVRRLGRGRSS